MPGGDGLRWKETLFGPVPEWTRDPSIAAIETTCRKQLCIPPEEACDAAFYASGLFNKLYSIRRGSNASRMIMRVSLPVYPVHKTRAEVTILRNDNYIGFEWILMEFMEGIPAHTRWRAMSMKQKVAFAEKIAQFQAELSRVGKTESLFRGVGTLEPREKTTGDVEGSKEGVSPCLMVSPEFFMGNHLHYDIPRGPFRSTHHWLSTELDIILLHQTAILTTSGDEDDIEDAENVSSVARKLHALVPKIFPPTTLDEKPVATALYHHDLHLNNILVSEDDGEITAILDWECVSALPLWMSTKLPKFLEGQPIREEEPQIDDYADADESAVAAAGAESGSGVIREKNELYYIHKMEYEATQLRKVYKARLKELWPEWGPLEEENHAGMDLYNAISQCDGFWVKRIGRWADRIEKGEAVRLDAENL
ncbi:phosphotransferase enzyme family-domain-containing protein [Corynascus novoguineensis]|uniref:Phosphotransferase enzyme family-domain-containing protein n=1 Tax=Corynascus novoguineensis TaxID=1126955 RepID=A0AAN7CLN8_9PEZI|nr:phosphotransferase enzyme family-domain-containing protein [Corynascus novoguineensis]